MNRALRSSLSPIAELKFNNQIKGQELGMYWTFSIAFALLFTLATFYLNYVLISERLLCELVFKGNRKMVEDVLRLGVTPNCFDHHRRPPLHIAVTKGYCEMAKYAFILLATSKSGIIWLLFSFTDFYWSMELILT